MASRRRPERSRRAPTNSSPCRGLSRVRACTRPEIRLNGTIHVTVMAGGNDMTRLSGRSRAAWPAMRVILAAVIVSAMAVPSLRAEEPTVDELQKRIDERDTVIRDWVRRVEALERQTQPAAALPPAARRPGPSPAAAVAPVPVRPGTFPPAVQPAQQQQEQQQQQPAPAPGQTEVTQTPPHPPLNRPPPHTTPLLRPPPV